MITWGARMYSDGTYLRKNPTWHAEDANYKTRDIVTLLARRRIHPRTICDVGCGAGAILELLSHKLDPPAICTGYEISEQALALCRPRECANLHFVPGSLPEEGTRFDLVLAIDVVEHVDDYLGFLRELRNRGTHKIFRIPLNLSVQSVLFGSRPILQARESFGHLHYFTRETALATLQGSGYRILDSFLSFAPVANGSASRGRALLRACKRACFSIHREWVARLLDGFSLMVLAE